MTDHAKRLLELAKFFSELLKDEIYWMDFGTILGAVREGGLIEGDSDLDFGVLSLDVIYKYRKEIEDRGFWINFEPWRSFYLNVFFNKEEKSHADFWIFEPIGDKLKRPIIDERYTARLKKTVDSTFDKSFIEPLIEVGFNGILLKSVNNPLQFTKLRYKNWSVKDPTDKGAMK